MIYTSWHFSWMKNLDSLWFIPYGFLVPILTLKSINLQNLKFNKWIHFLFTYYTYYLEGLKKFGVKHTVNVMLHS